jgi:hypothetical protein
MHLRSGQFLSRNGTPIDPLEGEVDYPDGKQGKVSLEFAKDGEAWKVQNSSLEY